MFLRLFYAVLKSPNAITATPASPVKQQPFIPYPILIITSDPTSPYYFEHAKAKIVTPSNPSSAPFQLIRKLCTQKNVLVPKAVCCSSNPQLISYFDSTSSSSLPPATPHNDNDHVSLFDVEEFGIPPPSLSIFSFNTIQIRIIHRLWKRIKHPSKTPRKSTVLPPPPPFSFVSPYTVLTFY